MVPLNCYFFLLLKRIDSVTFFIRSWCDPCLELFSFLIFSIIKGASIKENSFKSYLVFNLFTFSFRKALISSSPHTTITIANKIKNNTVIDFLNIVSLQSYIFFPSKKELLHYGKGVMDMSK